jgi:hypothetical protein
MDIDVQPELQKLADRMTAMINGGSVEESTNPDGKQLVFYWEDMGSNTCIDLGLTTPGTLHVAADVSEYYPELGGMWMGAYSWEYELAETDSTSGVITVTAYNMWGEPEEGYILYSDYDGNTCKLSCDFLGLEDVEATVSTETISLYIENAGIM